MADIQQPSSWPMPKFYFSVTMGTEKMQFQEVSGLDVDAEPIEYRQGDFTPSSPIKMPGIQKTGNVTLKYGVFTSDTSFWAWFNEVKMNTVKPQTLQVDLMDETGKSVRSWTLHNAWPVKITGTDLKADKNEIAIEAIEIAYELP